jgi:hypothetical protein
MISRSRITRDKRKGGIKNAELTIKGAQRVSIGHDKKEDGKWIISKKNSQ